MENINELFAHLNLTADVKDAPAPAPEKQVEAPAKAKKASKPKEAPKSEAPEPEVIETEVTETTESEIPAGVPGDNGDDDGSVQETGTALAPSLPANFPAIEKIADGTHLVLVGPRELLSGMLPIRYLKMEQKNPKFAGKLVYGKDDNMTEYSGSLYPVIGHAWRQLSAEDKDGNLTALCMALDGEHGSKFGTCSECPKKNDCNRIISVYFLPSDPNDKFIYCMSLRGFAFNSASELSQKRWYSVYYAMVEHKKYKFIVPHFKADEKQLVAPKKQDIYRAVEIMTQQITR